MVLAEARPTAKPGNGLTAFVHSGVPSPARITEGKRMAREINARCVIFFIDCDYSMAMAAMDKQTTSMDMTANVIPLVVPRLNFMISTMTRYAETNNTPLGVFRKPSGTYKFGCRQII